MCFISGRSRTKLSITKKEQSFVLTVPAARSGCQAAFQGWAILLEKENVSWSELGGVGEITVKYSFELESHSVFHCIPYAIEFTHNCFVAGCYIKNAHGKHTIHTHT